MKKGLSPILPVWMIILIHHANQGWATSAGNVNGSLISPSCGGSVINCLFGGGGSNLEDEVAEFQMNSHIARMLFDVSKTGTAGTGNRNKPAVDCPRDSQYTTCLGSRNGKSTGQPCGTYTRPGSGC